MHTQDMTQEDGEGKAAATSFVMFYTSNWFGGTTGLTFEQKGFYIDLLLRMWERKGPLPDDVNWIAAHLGADRRTVRRLRQALIESEKLESRDGLLSNRRMMKEIAKALRRERPAKAPSKGTRLGQLAKLCKPEVPPQPEPAPEQDQPDFWPTSGELRAEVAENFPENPTKSMEAHPLSITRSQTLEDKQSATQQEAACTSGRADDDLISDLEVWMPPAKARPWLDALTAEFGPRLVRRGRDQLRLHMARGRPTRDPPGLWASICRRIRDEDAGGGGGLAADASAARLAEAVRCANLPPEVLAAEVAARRLAA